MTHVFPLHKTLPALRRLALVAALVTGTIGAAVAEEKTYTCGTVSGVEAGVASHPAYVTHIVLTGAEAARGINAIQPDTFAAGDLDTAILVLRADRAFVLIGFKADGGCGSMVISPDSAERVWRAIHGTNS